MLYDRPVHVLMREAAGDLPLPTTPATVTDWFARKYPLVNKRTVIAHIKGLTSNDRNRHHFSVSRYEPLFTWRDGLLTGYDPDIDLEGEDPAPEGDEDEDDVADGPPVSPAATEFVLEAHLEEFLLGNWAAVDWGRPLALWQASDGTNGHQLSTPLGRLDLLCVDTSTSALVVVELKRGRAADRVVGQAARYMGWTRAHIAAEGQRVEGIVVAHEQDDRLRYAAAAVPGLTILTYQVTFHLTPAPGITGLRIPGPSTARCPPITPGPLPCAAAPLPAIYAIRAAGAREPDHPSSRWAIGSRPPVAGSSRITLSRRGTVPHLLRFRQPDAKSAGRQRSFPGRGPLPFSGRLRRRGAVARWKTSCLPGRPV